MNTNKEEEQNNFLKLDLNKGLTTDSCYLPVSIPDLDLLAGSRSAMETLAGSITDANKWATAAISPPSDYTKSLLDNLSSVNKTAVTAIASIQDSGIAKILADSAEGARSALTAVNLGLTNTDNMIGNFRNSLHTVGLHSPTYFEPIQFEPTPKPLSRNDIEDIVKKVMKQSAKEGVIEGLPEAMERFYSKIDKEERDYNLSFKDRIIYFCDKEIKIPENTNLECLCKTIFQNEDSKRKIWNCDELIEDWGFEITKDSQRKAYTAARKINDKVAMETTIKNLFIVTTKTVVINPNYIK